MQVKPAVDRVRPEGSQLGGRPGGRCPRPHWLGGWGQTPAVAVRFLGRGWNVSGDDVG